MNLYETIQSLRVKSKAEANEEVFFFSQSGTLVYHFQGVDGSVTVPPYADYSGLIAVHNHPMRHGREYGLSLEDIMQASYHRLHSIHAVTEHQIFSFFCNPAARRLLNISFTFYALVSVLELSVEDIPAGAKHADRFRLSYIATLQRYLPGLFSTWISDPLPMDQYKPVPYDPAVSDWPFVLLDNALA